MDDPAAPILAPSSWRPGALVKGILAPFLLGALIWGLGVLPALAADPQGSSDAGGSGASGETVPTPRRFGQSIVQKRCLVFTAKSLRDRQDDTEHQDWVVLALENRCPVPVLDLQVELLLVDTKGALYGKVFWVLGQGERLDAGGHWEDTVAVPDPNNRIALAWTLRVLRADTYAHGRTPPPPEYPRDTR